MRRSGLVAANTIVVCLSEAFTTSLLLVLNFASSPGSSTSRAMSLIYKAFSCRNLWSSVHKRSARLDRQSTVSAYVREYRLSYACAERTRPLVQRRGGPSFDQELHDLLYKLSELRTLSLPLRCLDVSLVRAVSLHRNLKSITFEPLNNEYNYYPYRLRPSSPYTISQTRGSRALR